MDHHDLSAQNKIQCFHCIPHMRIHRHRYQKYASTLIISKVVFNFQCHQLVEMAILGLCKLEKFPKVATLARGGFGFWKPQAIQIHQKRLQYQPFLGSISGNSTILLACGKITMRICSIVWIALQTKNLF